MRFVALDVETANSDRSSICQIGISRFEGGHVVDEWSALVDPEVPFAGINVSVHGISAQMVVGQPTLPEVAETLRGMLEDTVCATHSSFDRVALAQAFHRYGLDPITTSWIDTVGVARRTWPDRGLRSYGLATVCAMLGHSLRHHDALEDARACGVVLVHALRESGTDLSDWTIPSNLGTASHAGSSSQVDAHSEGDARSEVVVFTGAMMLTRKEATELASRAGYQVASNVTAKTTLVVVGDLAATQRVGGTMSGKHRKAESLAAAGQQLRIISETDFFRAVR